MTWYDFLLFAHIAMAAIWVGGGAMIQFFGLRAINAPDPMRLAQLGQDIEWIGSRVLVPASALAVVSGILLVIDSDFWGFGDDWIVIGLVLFAITFLAGALFFGPESGRLGKLVEAEGPTSPAVQEKLRRAAGAHASRPDAALPDHLRHGSEAGVRRRARFWIAVLAFAALAALLVRNGLNAQLAGEPAPARE